MGQSLVKNYVHIIFCTKLRRPVIKPHVENRLHAYISATCRALDCPVQAVGGYHDHIHVLCMLSKNITLSDLLCKVKTSSSKWLKQQNKALRHFQWQEGYAAFSVYPKDIEVVQGYIQNQREHHRRKSFKKELVHFLKVHGIEYNEKYL